MEIGGSGAGAFDVDKLNVTGNLNIGAGVNLTGALINNFTPTAGQSFTIIQNSGQRTGTFVQGSSINISGTLFSDYLQCQQRRADYPGRAKPDTYSDRHRLSYRYRLGHRDSNSYADCYGQP